VSRILSINLFAEANVTALRVKALLSVGLKLLDDAMLEAVGHEFCVRDGWLSVFSHHVLSDEKLPITDESSVRMIQSQERGDGEG